MPKFRKGTRVTWSVGRGRNRRTFTGRVVSHNPRIAPGAKYGVRIGRETYYPICRVRRARRRK